MTTHIALLRGINVGGNKQVAMADLRQLLAALGLADGQSLLQSGNLVFRGGARSNAELEELLEAGAHARLGLETEFFVRTAAEWRAIVAGNPLADEAKRDPGHLHTLLLKDRAAAKEWKALDAAIVGREVVRGRGTYAYAFYPDGAGRSRLTTALIDRTLRTRVTARNWNTVLRIAALTSA
jgi:uncharacterized protein (DUF1697 family)